VELLRAEEKLLDCNCFWFFCSWQQHRLNHGTEQVVFENGNSSWKNLEQEAWKIWSPHQSLCRLFVHVKFWPGFDEFWFSQWLVLICLDRSQWSFVGSFPCYLMWLDVKERLFFVRVIIFLCSNLMLCLWVLVGILSREKLWAFKLR